MKHETTAHLAATLLAADVQFLHVSDHEKERRREQALHQAHGEGYHLCRDICRQPGHAETNVLGMAGALARGGVIYLEGHDRLCEGCREACGHAEVTVVRADGVVLLQPDASASVTFFFSQTPEELQP